MIFIIGAGSAFALVLWRGYVLSILWGWFIVSLFHVPALSIPYALGISLILNLLTHGPEGHKKDPTMSDTENMFAAFVYSFILSSAALGIGWIVKGFI